MSRNRKLSTTLVLVTSMLFLILMYITWRDDIRTTRKQWALSDVTDGDALPAAENLDVPSDSIFFLETSGRGRLKPRQACAVESAVRIHPERNIYVFFNSPVSNEVLTNSCLTELLNFDNVKVGRIHTAEYAKGTPLQEILAERFDKESDFKVEDMSDMLRLVTLYKYGGLYLDTDVLVVKRLDALGQNWVARQDTAYVANGIIASDKDGLGHEIIEAVLEEIKSNYRPDVWSYNGPGAITRVLQKHCNTTKVSDLSADVCKGFQVYNPDLIYPIPYQSNALYFKPGDLTKDQMEKVYTHHVWNRLTHNSKLEKDSPYDKLTQKHCPTIRTMFGDTF